MTTVSEKSEYFKTLLPFLFPFCFVFIGWVLSIITLERNSNYCYQQDPQRLFFMQRIISYQRILSSTIDALFRHLKIVVYNRS